MDYLNFHHNNCFTSMIKVNSFFSKKRIAKHVPLYILLVLALNLVQASDFENKNFIIYNTHAKSSLQELKPTRKYIDSLFSIGRGLARRNADSALIIGKKIKNLSKILDYPEGIAMAQETIARANVNKGNYEKGIALAKETLNYAQEIGANKIYLDCINILGLAHFLKQELHNVYRYNQLGLKYAKEIGNTEKMFMFSNNAGTILARISDYEKALEFYNSCLSMLEQNPDSVKLAQVLNNLGSMLYYKGDFKNSKQQLQESIKISSILHMTSWESDAHITLANIALSEKDYAEAENQLKKSNTLLKDSKDSKQIIETALGFAKLEMINNEFPVAETFALEALQKAKQATFYRGIIDASELLHEIYAKQNKNKQAYQFLMMHSRLTDSLNLANNTNQVKVMVVEKNLKNEQEIVKLKLNQRLAKQNIYIGIAVGSLLVLGTILFLIKRVSDTRKNLITQLNIKTEELEKNKKELIDLNNTKDKLFSIIGHDLKSPIGSLQSLLNLLGGGNLSKNQFMSFIPGLTDNVNHLNFTLNNLLSWAITQLKGVSTNPSKTNLKELVVNNFNLFQTKSNHKSIQLINTIKEDNVVWADRSQIDIVLRNLINNAIKFTGDDGTITVSCYDDDKFKIISVKDTGVGIPNTVLNSLFKSSTAVTTYGTKDEKGTGLGLSICKEMVENNGGKIWVKSILNEGTTFLFSVPKAPM